MLIKQLKGAVFNNAVWLLLDKALRIILKFTTSIIVANYVGVDFYGELNYVISVNLLVFSLASFGLSGIVVREFIKSRYSKQEILSNSLSLRIFGSILSLIVLFIVTRFFHAFEVSTAHLLLIFALGYAFTSFDILDFWFQSKLNSKPATIVRMGSFVLISLSQIIAVYLETKFTTFVAIMSSEYFLVALIYILLVAGSSDLRISLKVNLEIIQYLLKQSGPLIRSGIGAIIYLKIDVIMLKEMMGTEPVGVYAVAVQFSELWYFIPVALGSSFFPKMVEVSGTDAFEKKTQGYIAIMILISLIIAIGVSLLGPYVIQQFYLPSYWQAGSVLLIHIWASIFIFIRQVFSKWLIACDLTKYSLHSQLFGALVNVVLNLIFIKSLGLYGAAMATLVSYASSSVFILFLTKDLRPFAYLIFKAISSPVVSIKYAIHND